MKNPVFIYFLFLLLCGKASGFAFDDSTGNKLLAGEIEELKNKERSKITENKVSVAGYFDVDKYEAPGVITTITSQEIQASGARGLGDLLMLVPGFNLASDIQNGLAFGLRGNWTHEGKILWMLDGIPLNEIGYGTFVVGGRIPLTLIDHIEIIRGAGSSVYGGLAGLGVINIITKKGQGINGHKLFANGGMSNKTLAGTEGHYLFGGKLMNGTEITASAALHRGNRSNFLWNDPSGQTVNFADSSAIYSAHLYFAVKKNGFMFKQLFEDYNFQSTYEPIYSQTRTFTQEFSHTLHAGQLTLLPIVRYTFQLPWNTTIGDPALYGAQNIKANRLYAGLACIYPFSKKINLSFGSHYNQDSYRYFFNAYQQNADRRFQKLIGINFYAEFFANLDFAKIFAGVRIDKFAFFKPFVAPRIIITKKFRKFFYKIMENYSYKLPTIYNIALSPDRSIVPEAIHELQAQGGFFSGNWEFSAVCFGNKLDKLIVFSVDSLQNETYQNRGTINTRGIEGECMYKNATLTIKASHSYYETPGMSSDAVTADITRSTIGFPTHKTVASFSYRIHPHVHVQVAHTLRGSFRYIYGNESKWSVATSKPTQQLQVTVNFEQVAQTRINVRAGIFNLLNQRIIYSYPYNSGYNPLLEMGREIHVQVSMTL